MSREEQRAFFLALLNQTSAAQIARETGYSDAAVSQVKNGKYKGDESTFLAKVLLVYGRWHCPALERELDYKSCSGEQSRPWSATRIREWAICQKCERRSG